jgi:hypothetical protein
LVLIGGKRFIFLSGSRRTTFLASTLLFQKTMQMEDALAKGVGH